MQKMTVFLWDKVSSINGVTAERLREKFTAENGNDDRVLIAYDGVLSRIQRIEDTDQFDDAERQNVQELITQGVDEKQAIADTWVLKLQREEREGLEQAEAERIKSNEQLRADLDYISIMTGVDLDV